MTGAAIAGEMTLRAISRRVLALALLLALPLAFYVARHAYPWQSIRFLGVGLAWATSTIALFAAVSAYATEPRLRVQGWTSGALIAGRLGALAALALGLAALYFVLVAVDRPVGDPARALPMLVATAMTGVALGSALGSLVARELEGALLLFLVAGLQMIADPSTLLAHLLPFWSTRELGAFAIEGAGVDDPTAGLAHAFATIVVCACITGAVMARRLRLWTQRS